MPAPSPNRSRRLSPLALAAVAGSALATLPTQGALVNWINAAGGNSDVAANWNPGLPTLNDTIMYVTNGTYPVTWVASSPAQSAVVSVGNNANVTAAFNAPHTITGNLIIKNSGIGFCSFTLTTGTLTAGSTRVGFVSSATDTATLSIIDDDADLLTTGVTRIGELSPGIVSITGGGLFSAAGDIVAGEAQPATMTVSGVNAAPLVRSTLVTTGAGDDLRLGTLAPATLNISSGALVDIFGDTYVGQSNTTGTTAVTIAGISNGSNATLDTGNLFIGNNNAAGAGGTGSVTVDSGGVLTVAGPTIVGDPSGGSGTFIVQPGAQVITIGLAVDPANGTLEHRGGSLTVSGGTYTPRLSTGAFRIGEFNNNPILNLINNAQWNAPAVGGGDILLSSPTAGGATLNVAHGADLVQSGGALTIGNAAGSTGHVSIDSGATVSVSGTTILLGNSSSLSLAGGASLTTSQASIGSSNGTTVSCTITGAGTTLNASNELRFGSNNAGTIGGAVDVVVSNGAAINSTFVNPSGPSIHFRNITGSGGSLTMNNATLDAADEVSYVNSVVPMSLTNSTINAPRVTFTNASVNASGLINAEVVSVSGVTTVTATGNLTLGTFSTSSGVALPGQMVVGPHTVTLRDANAAVPGSITLAGGTVVAANGISLAARNLGGFGTVDADIIAAAGFSPTGTGLVMLGDITSSNTITTGTKIAFANGSSYAGNWSFNCDVSTLSGSTFSPTQGISMGRATSATGVELDGTLIANNVSISMLDSDGPRIGGTVNLLSGSLFSTSPVTFAGGLLPRLTGVGAVNADTTMNGRIEPGTVGGDETGHISFVTLTMGVTGSLVIDIEGEAAGEFDTIATVDEFDLGGVSSLTVNRLNNFYPTRGARFTIITGGRFDTFGTISAPGFHVEYLPTRVDLVFDGLCDSIDFNNDELFPDTADIDDLLSVFSGGPCTNDPNCNDIDFNNDGLFPDTADIDDMLRVFSGGPCVV